MELVEVVNSKYIYSVVLNQNGSRRLPVSARTHTGQIGCHFSYICFVSLIPRIVAGQKGFPPFPPLQLCSSVENSLAGHFDLFFSNS